MAFYGVCYGPYRKAGWRPPSGPSADSVDADMKTIASRGITHIRTYGVAGGNQWNADKATKYNLSLGLGVEAHKNDSLQTIKTLITQGLSQAQQAAMTYKRSLSLDLVIGNEVNLEGLDPTRIRQAMEFARQEKPRYPSLAVRVTSCLTGTALQNAGSVWEAVVKDCETVVYLTVYPWYAFKAGSSADPGNIDPNMRWSWDNGLKQAVALGKQVVIAEIGWPSDGAPQWKTSVANEKLNYATTRTWVSGQNFLNKAFDTFWFEMFDEPWKTAEGAWGPHWGLYTSGDNPQPKF
ncbi:MAG TPA: glycosyl hydrolase family 17 protein [Reyranella sp.]